jgi:peptide chain release factor 1
MDLIQPLEQLSNRFKQILQELSDPGVTGNTLRFQQLSREHSRLAPIMGQFESYKTLLKEAQDLTTLQIEGDPAMKHLAAEELERVTGKRQTLERELQKALLPRDPNEDRDILLEIRAGAGGDEAGLFAADLLRMYSHFAEKHGWKIEPVESNVSERGGIKEVIVQISGQGVWNYFKFERGVHRVQRVPETEASGRVHTSTATVAVLPQAEEVDIRIDPAELRIDTYRAHGAGGQHINKTDSAVRITHLPTGLVVACQDERSQIKNRVKAMKLLRSRLLQQLQDKHQQEIAKDRKSQVGTGDRSEKIRTYNFPQDRITDHRINMNVHNLPVVMEGGLDELIDALQKDEQARLLASATDSPADARQSGSGGRS